MVVYSMEANTGKSYFKLLKWFSQIMTRSPIVPRLPCACARKYICKFCSWKFNVKYTHGEFQCPPLRLGNFCCRKYSCTKTITAGENVFSQNTCEHKTCTKYFYSRKTWLFFFFFQVSQQKSNVCVLFLFFSRSDTCEQSFSHALQNLEMMAVELLVNIIFMSLDYRGPWFASMQLSFFSFLFFFFFGITVPCDEPECCLLFLYRLSGLRE